ncbi:exported protein of unknown function [Candidatus Hydrogenisulfobacillus filiaventi]|uniref:Uncharacterized protein n=1 Tax=Candidatus Hydrogenisulfobacillus filiaventi TaxID=2707344 RepID=A0A6F8ZJK2_9FIRM|nr:exported protein of unknown function [Candidatus Hydrogenisulfobacillus filiaventi]
MQTTRRGTAALAAGTLVLMLAGAVPATTADQGWNGVAQPPAYQERIFPPWSHGANDPATHQGLHFTVPEVDDMPDFHGDLNHPKLVIFVGGNYFFAMAPLVAAFEQEHPSLKGRIFYETLPPGILVKQMQDQDTITVGNLTFTVHPDVYAAGLRKVDGLIRAGMLQGPAVPYVTNDLAIMVPKGNPGHVTGLTDLGRPGLRLSMPNPAYEGVARQIEASLVKAGGPALEKEVYQTKVADGQTILTHIHHRQTPLYLMQGIAQAGVTWKSEAIFQEMAGHPISYIPIPARYNTTATYAAAVVKGARHPRAAEEWVHFLASPQALAIFERYGFKPVPPSKPDAGPVIPPFASSPVAFPVSPARDYLKTAATPGRHGILPDALGLPVSPVYFPGLAGWVEGRTTTSAPVWWFSKTGNTIPKYDGLVIRQSRVEGNTVVIPAGGLLYYASPARGELPLSASPEYILGKRYYFVNYDPHIYVKRNFTLPVGGSVVIGNQVYTLAVAHKTRVNPVPVLHWRTLGGFSIRPYPVSLRFEHPQAGVERNQPALDYLQGVIRSVDGNRSVTFASLTGTGVDHEWWSPDLAFNGYAAAGQVIPAGTAQVHVQAVDPKAGTVTVSLWQDGRRLATRVLGPLTHPQWLPEDSAQRARALWIDGSTEVEIAPNPVADEFQGSRVHLRVYGQVSELTSGQPALPFSRRFDYLGLVCPIGHHVGLMLYNPKPIVLRPGVPFRGPAGYFTLTVDRIAGRTVTYTLANPAEPAGVAYSRYTFTKQDGNIDTLGGQGRDIYGLIATLTATYGGNPAFAQDFLSQVWPGGNYRTGHGAPAPVTGS